MKECPYCKSEIDDQIICPNCKREVFTKREEVMMRIIEEKFQKERDRIDSSVINNLQFAKIVLVSLAVLFVASLTIFGFTSFNSLKSHIDNIASELEVVLRNDVADINSEIKEKIEQQFEDERIRQMIEMAAKEQTDEAVKRIVEDRVNQRMEDYNTIILALNYDRKAFFKLNELKQREDVDISKIADITMNSVKGSIESSDTSFYNTILKNGNKYKLEECEYDQLISLFENKDVNTRLNVYKFISMNSCYNTINTNIEIDTIKKYLLNRIKEENDLRVIFHINNALNCLFNRDYTIVEINKWQKYE